ncbi:MAG TPA: TonB-dependent receptor, partial [Blastocatellia bacterium]|nr:TonB-dependent receptor [Blastocatellia bacterium]
MTSLGRVDAALAARGLAQGDRGALTGTVLDPEGRVLADVRILATRQDTGFVRGTVSSVNGAYDLPELPVGHYAVTFALSGFQELNVKSVAVTVGQTITLNVTLSVAGASEHVKVSADTSELNQTSDSLGSRIERKQVDDLPMNGRNWATLTALAPGAIDAGGSNQRTIRFAGRGLDDNNFTSDGIDATNIVNQAQQSFVRLAIPTDTIQEFRVDSMLVPAETGSTPGGQVSITTPSGTNQFHGDVFEFVRNDVFDARNTFDRAAAPSPFRLNQFGGSVGGPIVPGKMFFFASFEGLRQVLTQPLQGFVPSDSLRTQIAAQSPALVGIVNSYPQGQTPLNSLVNRFNGSGSQLDNENSGMIRIDRRFSENTTGFVRFNIDDAVSSLPLGGSGQFLDDRQDISSSPANLAIELLHIFSSTKANEVKFGFNRGTVFTNNVSQSGLAFSITVPGLTALNNNQQKAGVGNSFSFIDNFTWVKDRHVIKSGIEVRRIQLQQGNTASGAVSYASLTAFAANQVNSASFAAPLPENGLRKTEFYAFVQDEFKLRPNLTLNLGLRYQFFNQFHEVLGRAVPFDFATCGPSGFCGAGAGFGNPNLTNLDPRLAVAWTPAAFGGKTVLRAGFGVYHGDGQLDDQNLPIANEVQRFSLSGATTPALTFPIDPFLSTTPGIVSPRDMDRNRKDMYVTQWGA